jgi:hypothetical protein
MDTRNPVGHFRFSRGGTRTDLDEKTVQMYSSFVTVMMGFLASSSLYVSTGGSRMSYKKTGFRAYKSGCNSIAAMGCSGVRTIG